MTTCAIEKSNAVDSSISSPVIAGNGLVGSRFVARRVSADLTGVVIRSP